MSSSAKTYEYRQGSVALGLVMFVFFMTMPLVIPIAVFGYDRVEDFVNATSGIGKLYLVAAVVPAFLLIKLYRPGTVLFSIEDEILKISNKKRVLKSVPIHNIGSFVFSDAVNMHIYLKDGTRFYYVHPAGKEPQLRAETVREIINLFTPPLVLEWGERTVVNKFRTYKQARYKVMN